MESMLNRKKLPGDFSFDLAGREIND